MASSFRVVSDTYPVGHSSGLLTAWEQQKGHLLIGGDMKVVRLWDATVERHLRVGRHSVPLFSPRPFLVFSLNELLSQPGTHRESTHISFKWVGKTLTS